MASVSEVGRMPETHHLGFHRRFSVRRPKSACIYAISVHLCHICRVLRLAVSYCIRQGPSSGECGVPLGGVRVCVTIGCMENLIAEYLSHLRVERGSSPRTVSAYELDLADYAVFLGEHGLTEAGDVRREDVVAYESSLVDRGYAPSSVKRRVSVVKGFHRFLVREGYVGKNPTDALALPKVPEALPDVLSVAQMDALLSAPHDCTPRALRDQAILEVLYGCGLRASEAVGLDLGDVLLDEGYLRVVGKGNKERIAPVSGAAASALVDYLDHGRDGLRKPSAKPTAAVFLNARGGRPHAPEPACRRGTRRARYRRPEPASPHAAPLLRHPHAGGRSRPARHSGDLGACRHIHHTDIHACEPLAHPRGIRQRPPPREAFLKRAPAHFLSPLSGAPQARSRRIPCVPRPFDSALRACAQDDREGVAPHAHGARPTLPHLVCWFAGPPRRGRRFASRNRHPQAKLAARPSPAGRRSIFPPSACPTSLRPTWIPHLVPPVSPASTCGYQPLMHRLTGRQTPGFITAKVRRVPIKC